MVKVYVKSAPPLKVGIAGLGVVGAGVVRLLDQHATMLAARAGRPIKVVAVSARTVVALAVSPPRRTCSTSCVEPPCGRAGARRVPPADRVIVRWPLLGGSPNVDCNQSRSS